VCGWCWILLGGCPNCKKTEIMNDVRGTERTRPHKVIAVTFTEIKDKVVGSTSSHRERYNFQRERCTGFHGKDLALFEELEKKEPGNSSEYKIVLFLPAEGIGVEPLLGVTFGVEHNVVRGEVFGPCLVGG